LKTGEGYTSGGSNPPLSATIPINALNTELLQLLQLNIKEMETFRKQKQQSYDYLTINTKYLIKIKEIYYFCFRFKNRIVKYSLRCKDLYKSNIIKIKLIERLKMHDKFDMLKSGFSMNTFIDKDEDPKKVKEIEEKILNLLAEEKKKGNINKVEMNSHSIDERTIIEAFDELIDHKENVDKLTGASLGKYKTSLRYILLFCDEDKKIHSFNKQFFKDMQKKIRLLPKDALKLSKYKYKKYEYIMKDYENIEYETLSNRYINDLFKNLNQFFKFFEYENFIVENVVESRILKSDTKHILNFEDNELKLLINDLDCDLSKNIFDIGLYTGMRIGEISELQKDNIDLKENIITITKSKTKSGLRVIPIHKNILDIIKFHYDNDIDNYLFSAAGNVNKITKLMARRIKKVINIEGKSFHSTRKNITMKRYELHQKGEVQQNTIDRILGHKVDSLSFNTYNLSKIDLGVLRDCIDKIRYDF